MAGIVVVMIIQGLSAHPTQESPPRLTRTTRGYYGPMRAYTGLLGPIRP